MILTRNICPDTGIRKGQCWCSVCDHFREHLAELLAILHHGDCPYQTQEECEMYLQQIEETVTRMERDL